MSGNVWKRLGGIRGIIELPRIIILDIRCVSFWWRLPEVSGRHVRMGSWRSLERWFPTNHDQNWSNVGRQPWKLRTIVWTICSIMLHIHEYMKLKNLKIWEGHLSHNEKIWEEYEADWSGRYGSLVRLYRTGDGLSSGGARLDKFGSNDSNEDDDALWDLICFTKPFPKESHQKLSSQRINGFIQSRGMLAALFVTKTWLIWLLPQEQHITMEDASSLLVNSWTAMSVFFWFSEACFKQHLGPHFE